MDVEHNSDALMQVALNVTRILYRDRDFVFHDPYIRTHILAKILCIKRSIGLPETDNEQILLNHIARLEMWLRKMIRSSVDAVT